MKRMVLPVALLVALPWHSTAIASSEADDVNAQLEVNMFNHCDMVFHCVTTRYQSSDFNETKRYKNEAFMFALKGGALIVPNEYSPLGDGTLDYEITEGGCLKGTKKLVGDHSGKPWFRAEMLEEKWVEFTDGKMFGIDASGDSVRYQTRIWYAQCESFE